MSWLRCIGLAAGILIVVTLGVEGRFYYRDGCDKAVNRHHRVMEKMKGRAAGGEAAARVGGAAGVEAEGRMGGVTEDEERARLAAEQRVYFSGKVPYRISLSGDVWAVV